MEQAQMDHPPQAPGTSHSAPELSSPNSNKISELQYQSSLSMKIVKDIIARKPAPSNFIRPDALVIDALNMLSSVNLSYLVVMEGDTYEGIFSERDYSRNLVLKGRSSSTTKVQEVMSTDFPFVELNDTVEYCMNMMNTHKTRYLVAYDKGRFAGVITIHDLLRQVLFNREEVFDYSIASELIDNDESSKVF